MSGLLHDVRHALRALGRAPGFTALALAILTLSIGVLTAIFSVVDAVMLRGLPFVDSERLVAVGELNFKDPSSDSRNRVAPQNFLDWRERQDVLLGLAATWETSVTLRAFDQAEPEVLRALWTTADLFNVLQVKPLIGRTFTRENEVDGRARVAVISYGLWQRRFGGSPDIVGRSLPGILGDLEILGVMPPTFEYPVAERVPIEVWLPYVARPEDRIRGNSFGYNLHVVGRLHSGVSISQAQARMDVITAELAAETPRWFTNRVAKVEPLLNYLTRPVRTWMVLLLAAVVCVMLIACVNLANLMLVRATTRARELAVRTALGASRWTLARMLLTESVLLALAGAAGGLLLASVAVDALRATLPAEVPRAASIALDWRVFRVTTAVAVVVGIVFGSAPLLLLRQSPVGTRGATAGFATQWLRSALVTAEVSFATVLLIGAGLFTTSFARVTAVELGIRPERVIFVRVRPYVGSPQASTGVPVTSVEDARTRHPAMLERVLERVQAIPGVEMAALANGGLPLRGDLITANFGIPGRELPRNTDIDLNEISPDYFEVLGVPLVRGRLFAPTDRQGSPAVAILNEHAARRYFGDADPIGQIVRLRGERTVIGIVGNVRHDGPESALRTQAFIPFAQSRLSGATLVIRTGPNPLTLVSLIKSAIWTEFPGLPLSDVHPVEDLFARLTAQRRFNMLILGLLGALGLTIASVGVYGVIAYVVAERTNEIGIRMALGALPVMIMRSVLPHASTHVIVGTLIGVIASWSLADAVRTFLFGVEPRDPAVYFGAVAILMSVALVAAFVPARRAARVDPLVALRYE